MAILLNLVKCMNIINKTCAQPSSKHECLACGKNRLVPLELVDDFSRVTSTSQSQNNTKYRRNMSLV